MTWHESQFFSRIWRYEQSCLGALKTCCKWGSVSDDIDKLLNKIWNKITRIAPSISGKIKLLTLQVQRTNFGHKRAILAANDLLIEDLYRVLHISNFVTMPCIYNEVRQTDSYYSDGIALPKKWTQEQRRNKCTKIYSCCFLSNPWKHKYINTYYETL